MIDASPVKPSWKQGFARDAAWSARPQMWKNLVRVWVPALGWTGMTLRDMSGRHAHGTHVNDPEQRGDFVRYDGGNDYTTLGVLPITTLTLLMSVRFHLGWRTFDQVVGNNEAGVGGFRLMTGGGGNADDMRFRVTTSASEQSFYALDSPVFDGEWHTLGCQIDAPAEQIEGFVDGLSVGTASAGGTYGLSTNALHLASSVGGGSYTPIDVGIVCIWDRLLAESESVSFNDDPLALVRLRSSPLVGVVGAPPAGNRRRRMMLFGAGA